MLNEQSPISLYHQLKEHIITKIRIGEWKINDKIPTERELCDIYQVSRITVRQALDDLALGGYIYKKQGKGTFVKERKYEQRLGSLYSFGEEIKKMGAVPSSTILDFQVVEASDLIAAKLGMKAGDPVYLLKRLRNANQEPYALEFSYIPYSLAKGLNAEELGEKGLYTSLKDRCGIEPEQATETFESVILPNDYVKSLKTKRNSAGLLIERITDWNGIHIELCESFVRGDKYKYHIVLKKEYKF